MPFLFFTFLFLAIPDWKETKNSSGLNKKISCIWYTAFHMQLGVGLNSKQRQRQNTDGFSCKLHLMTLELINTLYQNTWYHNLDKDQR